MITGMENYLGAKNGSGVYQAIINLIPPHDTYIEPFLGTGAVLRRKAPSACDIGVDLNKTCIDSFDYPAVNLYHTDAFSFLQSFDFNKSGRTVVYCDPPYVHSSRTSKARYEYELTDIDHKELLSLLAALPCYVLLSGYRNNIYDNKLLNWWSMDFQAMTRGGVRTETIWCNFTPGEVHYHTYAGKDFTDRQRIKRKATRWAKNFASCPAAERQAILAAILSVTDIN